MPTRDFKSVVSIFGENVELYEDDLRGNAKQQQGNQGNREHYKNILEKVDAEPPSLRRTILRILPRLHLCSM